jgi:hypothetical protein
MAPFRYTMSFVHGKESNATRYVLQGSDEALIVQSFRSAIEQIESAIPQIFLSGQIVVATD